MPATRTANIWTLVRGPAKLRKDPQTPAALFCGGTSDSTTPPDGRSISSYSASHHPVISPGEINHYPQSDGQRTTFRTKIGKKVTPHQWAVYDYILKIPRGRVTTYKSICDALGQGSPRSVGSALRNNPFAPYVPCHRVIATNLYLGGYCGEWGPQAKSGTQFSRKLDILREEGVTFDEHGMLKNKEDLW